MVLRFQTQKNGYIIVLSIERTQKRIRFFFFFWWNQWGKDVFKLLECKMDSVQLATENFVLEFWKEFYENHHDLGDG